MHIPYDKINTEKEARPMKKTLAILAAILCCTSTVLAGSTTIPYPAGTDTASAGASSAPTEINHAISPYFNHPDYYNLKSNESLTILPHYKTYQQTTEETCGPAAGLTLLDYYGKHGQNEAGLRTGMKTKPYPIGTSLTDMADYFKSLGWKTDTSLDHKPFATYEAFQDFALKNLKAGTPILVENVYWGGHWRVLIGYDTMGTKSPLDDMLIFADSYDTCDHLQDGYSADNGELFYAMWFDYSMLPKDQQNQPWIIATPR